MVLEDNKKNSFVHLLEVFMEKVQREQCFTKNSRPRQDKTPVALGDSKFPSGSDKISIQLNAVHVNFLKFWVGKMGQQK